MTDDRTVERPPPTETEVQSSPSLHSAGSHGLPAVPGYTVTHELARGGMGVVYAAHDPAFDRAVAVKVMHAGLDADRFVVEAKITARLPHPGIPPVYALGTLADGRPYLVMKLIEGPTLADELRHADRPRLPASFERICETVGFAHALGIVHRDLKPSNVMVGAFGEVLVMDWGLARGTRNEGEAKPPAEPFASTPRSELRAPHFQETQAGAIKGTPAFMAPEQARGEPVDARADVFALGGILAVMLTGKPPFVGDTVLDTVLRAAEAQLAACFAQLAASGADADIVAVARRCLAPDPADRFPDGAAVARAVAAYRAGVEARLSRAERDRAAAEATAAEAVNTRRESEARAAEQRKRRRVQLALAVAVALLAVGAGAVAWWEDRQEAKRGLAAERATAERERDDAARALADQRAEGERAAQRERDAADRRAGEARLVGERDAEARNKAIQAKQGVAAGLALAADLRKQYRFAPAAAALAQAEGLARGGAPELLGEVERARADLALVAALDDIRFRKWVYIVEPGVRGAFNTRTAPPAYRKAFAAVGFDAAALEPAALAKRVTESGVKAAAVAALDDWALYEPDAALRDKLLEVARRADPHPWADRLRDPTARADRDALAKLAAEADPAAVAPAALSVLASLMERSGLNPVPLLTAARGRYPADFELAFVLALVQKGGREVGSYEAARAIRPDHMPAWNNLGYALGAQGDGDGAIAAFKGAIRLDPNYPPPHNNLGVLLYFREDYAGAAREWGEVVRLSPDAAKGHDNLGLVRHRTGDLKGAEESYRTAIRLDPELAAAYSNLGALFRERSDPAEAIAWVRKATQIDPKYSNAHALLGTLLRETGDIPGARAALTEAARLNPARYGPLLAQLPPLPAAPPPRAVRP